VHAHRKDTLYRHSDVLQGDRIEAVVDLHGRVERLAFEGELLGNLDLDAGTEGVLGAGHRGGTDHREGKEHG